MVTAMRTSELTTFSLYTPLKPVETVDHDVTYKSTDVAGLIRRVRDWMIGFIAP
jgi:hypothetical protein